jgi:hypothetical protein
VITNARAGAELTVTTQRGAGDATVTVQAGKAASIYVERLDTCRGVFVARGTALTGGSVDWNPAEPRAVKWEARPIMDPGLFTHDTVVDAHEITVRRDGHYLVVYNDALHSQGVEAGYTRRDNPLVSVRVNGHDIAGGRTKCHYMRIADGHTDSSGCLVFLVSNLRAHDRITVTTVREPAAGISEVNADDDALLFLWRKWHPVPQGTMLLLR